MAQLSYPRTVSGLVAELEKNGAEALALAMAFLDFAAAIAPPPSYTGRTVNVRTRHGQQSVRVAARPTAVSTGRIEAAEIARALSAALSAVPDIVAALKPLTLAVPAAAEATGPLFVPDPNDVRVIRNAGTGEVNPDPWAAIVPWWPALPAGVVGAGLTVFDVEPDALVIGFPCSHAAGSVERAMSSPWGALISSANALQLIRTREVGLDQLARRLRGGRGASRGQQEARRATRAAANAYRDWSVFLGPLCDRLASQYGQFIQTMTSALHALSDSEGIDDVPTLTTTPAVIASLATRIRAAIDSGHGGRLQVSDQEQSFSWAPGPAVTLLSYLSQGTVTGRRTTVVTAKDATTVIGPVAEAAAKSMVVDFDSADVNLSKYPGQATITVEAAQFTNNIEAAISTVLVGQIVRAIELDASTAIKDASGIDIVDAADITAGVLAAIAAIRGNGGAPNVVGLSAADWIAIMGQTGASGFVNFANVEAGPAGLWLGTAPVIVPGLAAGSAIVADGRSVTISEPAGGPLCIVDPFTAAKNNKIIITVEAWAVAAVTSPGGVATVTVKAATG